MTIHVCRNFEADEGNVWALDDDLMPYQLPRTELTEDTMVATCSQGACREPAVILDHYFPYEQSLNHCAHCANVLLDRERGDAT